MLNASFGLLPLLVVAKLQMLSATPALPTGNIETVGSFDEESSSNLSLLTGTVAAQGDGGPILTNLLLPDLNDSTGGMFMMGLSCDLKPPMFCGQSDVTCYRCKEYGKSSSGRTDDIVKNSSGPASWGFIAVKDDFLVGVIEDPAGAKFDIRTTKNGPSTNAEFSYRGLLMKDVEISVTGIPVPDDELIPLTRRLAEKYHGTPMQSSQSAQQPVQPAKTERVNRRLDDTGEVIDLLYFFTYRGMCQWLQKTYSTCTFDSTDQSDLETMVATITAYSNSALEDSKVMHNGSNTPVSYRTVKVYVDDISNDEGEGQPSSVTMLYGVRDSSTAQDLRDEFSADLVVHVFATDYNGAYGIAFTPVFFPARDSGYSASAGKFSLLDSVIAHEIGHNFGANHNREEEEGGVNNESFYGYNDCNNCFGTIMSYEDNCKSKGCSSVVRVPYFSNTEVTYDGLALGDDLNNNSLQLSRAAPGIAINRFTSGNSIYAPNGYAYTSSNVQAVAFDIVPKTDLILKNIEVLISNAMEINVYIVTGPYKDVTSWGSPIVSETLVPMTEMYAKFHPIALYSSFPDYSFNSNEVYAIKIERKESSDDYMKIASVSDDGVHFENKDISVKSGRMQSFNGYEYSYVVGLWGGLIYEVSDGEEGCTGKNEVPLIVTVKTDGRVKKDKTQWKILRKTTTLGTGKLWKYKNNGANQKIEIYNECVHKNKCYKISLWEKNQTKKKNYGLKNGFVEVNFNGEVTKHTDWKAKSKRNWSVSVGNKNKC